MSRDDGELSLPLPLTTPAVRKMAKEMGIDLYAVRGSGPGGRILKEDLMNDIDIRVEQASQSVSVSVKEFPLSQAYSAAGPSSSSSSLSSSSSSSSSAVYREGERRTVPLRGLQRLMARSMTESLKIPQLSYSDDINCDQLVLLKEGMKAGIKKGKTAALPHNASPSILPLIIKATSLALKKHPIMNCSVHCAECSELVYNEDHNIGK
jgi:pyruvate/2-oxoglutarate dehydrogenase complex dihydrolipoamide acyltransferase (E2) component